MVNDVLRLAAHIGDGVTAGNQLDLEERKEIVENALKYALVCQQTQLKDSAEAGETAQSMMGGEVDMWSELLTIRSHTLSDEQKAKIDAHMASTGSARLNAYFSKEELFSRPVGPTVDLPGTTDRKSGDPAGLGEKEMEKEKEKAKECSSAAKEE